VALDEQDRTLWDAGMIDEGHQLVRRCLSLNQPGPYQLQAAINAVHSDPPPTDWHQILALYDQLLAFMPTPVVRLNRAIALAETDGPESALAELDTIELAGYHLFYATRADLLRRLRRDDEADVMYDAAIACAENAAERTFLENLKGGQARKTGRHVSNPPG
jgi:RNA polymerase sigma-70 factor, ECF subfamily